MRLSAIVPTHNRPEALRACLESLQLQDADPTAFEVVVVDDGSDQDMDALVSEVAATGSIPMRCERQSTTGLNGARNRGAVVSSGELLGFLDDDTLVSPGWASALISAFETQSAAGVGGRVQLRLEGSEPAWMPSRRNFLAEYDLGSEPIWLDTQPVPVGANCAVRRTEFERVGGFRVGLDRIGRSLVSNGDTEFFLRMRSSGARLRYEPRAHVFHCVPASRLTLRYFTDRYRAQGVSDELLFADRGEEISWRGRLGRARFAAAGATWLVGDALRGRSPVDGWLNMHYWAGRFVAYGKRAPDAGESATRGERIVDERLHPPAEPSRRESPRQLG